MELNLNSSMFLILEYRCSPFTLKITLNMTRSEIVVEMLSERFAKARSPYLCSRPGNKEEFKLNSHSSTSLVCKLSLKLLFRDTFRMICYIDFKCGSINLHKQDPLDGTHLDVVRGLIPTKRFHSSASTKRAQLSVAATAVRSTYLFNIMSSPESMHD